MRKIIPCYTIGTCILHLSHSLEDILTGECSQRHNMHGISTHLILWSVCCDGGCGTRPACNFHRLSHSVWSEKRNKCQLNEQLTSRLTAGYCKYSYSHVQVRWTQTVVVVFVDTACMASPALRGYLAVCPTTGPIPCVNYKTETLFIHTTFIASYLAIEQLEHTRTPPLFPFVFPPGARSIVGYARVIVMRDGTQRCT